MHLLNDSAAFTVAKSIKLGRDASDSRLPGSKVPYSNTQPPKQKYECVKDADCAGTLVCRSNKCIDPCTGVTCPGGQRCSVGKCVSCSRGEACGCSSPNVSNGSGACFDPCNPNYCASSTPTCSRSGANYSCACTSTSCGAGKKCSGSSCTNCAANESCNCPSGQKANGSGGCATVACSSNSDCGAGKQCANAGTTSAYCYNCSANSQCTCPSGQLANGSGGCVKPVCYDNTPCGAGRQCIDGGKYNAKCDPCPSGTQCTCPSGQVADGSGGCGVNSCDGYLTANGYGAAKDMASFKAALASGVSEIGITASFTVNEDVNLNGKKIYPASKYTGSPKCVAAGKPTLTIGKSVNLGNGRIENMNLTLNAIDNSVNFFTGGGTLKDTFISYVTDKWAAMFEVSGSTVNLEGINKIAVSTTGDVNYGDSSFKQGSTLNISGPLTISGNPAFGFYFEKSNLNVASTGSLTYTAGGDYSLFEGKDNSKMVFDGLLTVIPGKGNPYYQDGSFMIFELWSSSVTLNKAGNSLESGNHVFYGQQTSSVTINGSVNISMVGNRTGRHVFDMDSNATATLNAPVTITGLKAYSGQYELSQGDFVTKYSGKYTFNSTLTTSSGILYRTNLKGDVFTANAYINGISKAVFEASSTGTVTFNTGARIRLGGTCKKATKTETWKGTSQKYKKVEATSANNLGSPFSGGC